MGSMHFAVANGCCADLGIVQTAIHAGVLSSCTHAEDRYWVIWETFCHTLDLDGFLTRITNPVPFLQVYCARYLSNQISPSHHGVCSCMVDDVLHSVGQIFAWLGAQDI
jgi:hypothetical protein